MPRESLLGVAAYELDYDFVGSEFEFQSRFAFFFNNTIAKGTKYLIPPVMCYCFFFTRMAFELNNPPGLTCHYIVMSLYL